MKDLVIHSHSTYVQTIKGDVGGYFAVCATCGWQGSNDRKTRAEADNDGISHASATGYCWDATSKRFLPR